MNEVKIPCESLWTWKLRVRNVYPLTGVRPPSFQSHAKKKKKMELKSISVQEAGRCYLYTLPADWNTINVKANGSRLTYLSGREQETYTTAAALRKSQERSIQSTRQPSIQTAQRDSFQQRECSHLGSTVSEAERESLTLRQVDRQRGRGNGSGRGREEKIEPGSAGVIDVRLTLEH